MRPLALIMQAFGPYADSQTIDFADLKGRSFFLIHGPTGAGKTTILDGICFALYGTASGSQREGKSLRSDYALPELVTEVSFSFALGENRYRIRRHPEQLRPKKRGDGTTRMDAGAELWQENAEPERLLAAGWSDVTQKVEDLLGFKSSQFRQVVLLPQGEFRKLLTANSAERQEILQTLFKTDLYRAIEEKLKQKAQEIKKQFDRQDAEWRWILQEAGLNDREALTDRLAAHREELAVINVAGEAAAGLVRQTQERLTAAQLVAQKFAEQEAADRKKVELAAKVPVVEEKRQELAQAQKAAELLDAEAALRQGSEDCLALQTAQKQQEQALTAVRQEYRRAELALAAEEGREQERSQAAQQVLLLQQMEEKLNGLNEARQLMTQRQQAEQKATAWREACQSQATALTGLVEEQQAVCQEKAALAAQTAGLEAALREVKYLLDRRLAWDEIRLAAAQAKQRQVATEHGAVRLAESYEAAKSLLAELQENWINGQAALLAAKLEQGSPCPVCGSCRHPRPAVAAQTIPDETVVKRQQMAANALEKELTAAREALAACQAECRSLAERQQEAGTQLGDLVEADPDKLKVRQRDLQRQYEETLAAGRRLPVERQELEQRETARGKAAEALEAAEAAWRQAGQALQAAGAILQEREAAVPAAYRADEALQTARLTAERTARALSERLQQAQQDKARLAAALAKAETSLAYVQDSLSQAETRLATGQAAFDERLRQAGFTSSEVYRQAKKPSEYLTKLQQRLEAFDKEYLIACERAEQTAAAVAGLTVPALEVLAGEAAAAQAAQQELLAKRTTVALQTEREERWLQELTKREKDMAELNASYGLIGRLAEVANGNNDYKLTFQRFVLGALLDDVAEAANERLKMMSRGRYLLQRTMERARKNAAGGLELEVFDNHTGHARPVGTLSGGETFLASLSLALGLADVVQSYAGGVRLDTILVDEGFGTLDPETLDFAIKALLDLQQGGRLVGIISHVPELKERIDARLEISRAARGSRAEFNIG